MTEPRLTIALGAGMALSWLLVGYQVLRGKLHVVPVSCECPRCP